MLEKTRVWQMVQRAKALNETLAWMRAWDADLKSLVIEWVQKDQLTAKGIDGDGNVIGYYSLTTSLINPSKKFNTPYTLNDTGEFYRSMNTLVFQKSFVILGEGDKGEDNLYEKYGNTITTLTGDNLERLREILRQEYRKYVREALGIG
jgi:hypothetical protein